MRERLGKGEVGRGATGVATGAIVDGEHRIWRDFRVRLHVQRSWQNCCWI